MNKKHVAILLIIVLVLAILGATTFSIKKIGPSEPTAPERPVYPYVECDGDCNIPVSILPQPSAETHVMVNPMDPLNMVAASNDLNNPSDDVWLHYYTTKDGGKTWTDGRVPGYRGGLEPSLLTGMGTACDPAIAWDNDNNVYLAGVGYNRHQLHFGRATLIFVAHSSNGGESFDEVSTVHSSLTRLGMFNDKEWIAVDKNNGNVYVTWTIFTGNYLGQIMFSRSTDQARTWSTPQKLADVRADFDAQGSFVAVDKNSTIHVVWRDFSDDTLHYTKSSDNGASWAAVKDIAQMEPPAWTLENGTYRTPTMPTMAIDEGDGPFSGSIYVVWSDQRLGDSDIMLTYSRDGGETWSENYTRINNDTIGNGAHQFFGAITTSPQGYIHVMFYDKRYDPNQTLLGVTYAVSTDGGFNFSINLNVTDTIFNGDYGGKSNWAAITGDTSGFIGDYLGLTANNDTAVLVWADTRNASPDDGNSDIYCARVIFAGPDGDVNDTYEWMKEYGP